MTPKEKAKELVEKFAKLLHKTDETFDEGGIAYFIPTPLLKRCALICADELILENNTIHHENINDQCDRMIYWEEVKQEINKL